MNCESREGKYVPWTMGEWFRCSVCGERVRQSHTIRPLDGQPATYASIYPIPEHERRVAS